MAPQEHTGLGNPAEAQPAETTALSTDVKAAQGILAEMTGSSSIPALHNFVGDGLTQWRMTAAARSGKALGIDECEGKEIRLTHFYIHPVTLPGPTPGEIINSARCVLFDQDGAVFAFVSQGIAESLASIIQHCGMGPWNPAILVKVERIKTNRGFTMFQIVPA